MSSLPTDPTPDVAHAAEYPTIRTYVPASANLPELTWPAVLLGAILGIIFGASSLYLVLRVGMTVSASIPVAVLSITLFRVGSKWLKARPATILENNIVQTTGSAGESIAFGVGVTMPALMILGYDMSAVQVMLVAALGGLLGILMMIPLRRAFVVNQHSTLAYPEGTACAKVLIVGEQGGASARTVFTGFGVAFVYQILMEGMKLWEQIPAKAIKQFKGAVVGCEVAPVLLGVGYIIGPRIAAVTVSGGILAYLVLTPAISLFGSPGGATIFPGTKPIAAMSAKDIQQAYILYIGAGAVAAGGIISLLQALPMILKSLKAGLGDLVRSKGADGDAPSTLRTDRDLPIWVVGLGSTGLVAAIAASGLFPTEVDLTGRVAGALMIAVFGFLFVTVSSRLTGEIGSSSNPISGMTVATLLLTCLIFVLLGWVGPEYRVAAVSIAGIVCVAASNGGTTSQDLKTGFLIGATPRSQQWAILVGALSSAVVIGSTLLLLNGASTVVSNKAENLPTVAADPAQLTRTEAGPDGTTYKVWWVTEPQPGVEPGKYLVDDAGKAKYLIDPAINGRLRVRDDGSSVTKYDAPKARLMALIIDGIMRGQLPWSLVILGALIAMAMHLSLVPSLAFAVGVYLPLSTSLPIFLGGMTRALVDRIRRSSAEESDSSPAVLLASGYIAGGSIAGIGIALLALMPKGVTDNIDLSKRLPTGWLESPWPSLGAFSLILGLLLLCGLGVIFRDATLSPTLDQAEIEGMAVREEDL